MKTMKMSDIIVPESFAQTHPRKEKIDACKEHWIKTGRQSKYVVVNKENMLTDGYVMYLVLKELGVDEVKIIRSRKGWKIDNHVKEPGYRTENTTYVWGVHPNSPDRKIYVWRVPNCESWDEFKKNITVGDMIFCYAKGKVSPVIIKTIQTTNTCPTPLDVKKVCSKRIIRRSEYATE